MQEDAEDSLMVRNKMDEQGYQSKQEAGNSLFSSSMVDLSLGNSLFCNDYFAGRQQVDLGESHGRVPLNGTFAQVMPGVERRDSVAAENDLNQKLKSSSD